MKRKEEKEKRLCKLGKVRVKESNAEEKEKYEEVEK